MLFVVVECILALALALFIMGQAGWYGFITLDYPNPLTTLAVFLAALILVLLIALIPAHAMYVLKSGKGFWQRKLIPVNLVFALGAGCIAVPPVIILFIFVSSASHFYGRLIPDAAMIALLVSLAALIPLGFFLLANSFRYWLKIFSPASVLFNQEFKVSGN